MDSAPRSSVIQSDQHNQAYWKSLQRRLSLQLACAWFLDQLGPCLFFSSLVASVFVLLNRFGVLPGVPGAAGISLIMAGSIAAAIITGSKRIPRSEKAVRAKIEDALGLKNRLSAAFEGVVPWPPPPATNRRIFDWRWRQLIFLPAASLALIVLAFHVPVATVEAKRAAHFEKPPALERLEEIVEQLEPEQLVDEHALETLREKVAQLAANEPEGWYTHAALEASESLLRQTESGLAELASNFSGVATALDEAAGAGQGDVSMIEATPGLKAALHSLESGTLGPAGELGQKLRDARDRALDPKTSQELADALRENARKLEEMSSGSYMMTRFFDQLGPDSTPGNPYPGDGRPGQGTPGEEPDSGGVDRGPGSAPLALAANPTELETSNLESLEGFDPTRAALGDVTGQSVGRHELDRAVVDENAAGGSVANPGGGGNAAWTQNLTPEERRAVRRMFD